MQAPTTREVRVIAARVETARTRLGIHDPRAGPDERADCEIFVTMRIPTFSSLTSDDPIHRQEEEAMMREAIRASGAEAAAATVAARARSHARASALSDDLERMRLDAHRHREEAILAQQRARYASFQADHRQRQYQRVAWEFAVNDWAEAQRISRRGRSHDAAPHPESSTRASADGSRMEYDYEVELARALRESALEEKARRERRAPVPSGHPSTGHPFDGHPSRVHPFAGHPEWAPSDGTPHYPTYPTTPSAPPASRFRDDEAAQIAEAIRLSQEEANLAEALRRSTLESAPHHSAPLRPGSATASAADVRVNFDPDPDPDPDREREPSRRFVSTGGGAAYGIDLDGEDDEGVRRGARAYRDIARAAFRRTVFGDESASESKPATGSPRRLTDEDLAPPPRARRSIIDDARAALLAEERRVLLEAEEASRLERERRAADLRDAERRRRDVAAAAERRRSAERRRLREEALERERAERMERKRRSEAEEAARRSEEAAERVERESAARRAAADVGAMDLPDALGAVGFAPADATDPIAVRKAYKRAALRFHPDRTRTASLAERVRGEEVWKLLGSKMDEYAAATRDRPR